MLANDALACWQRWDAAALCGLCDAAAGDAAAEHSAEDTADLAWWRAMAALMSEDASALDHLAAAHEGFAAAGDAARTAVVAHAALVVCLLDTGAMQQVRDWQERAADYALPSPSAGNDFDSLWLQLGCIARVALGEADSPAAGLAAAWLAAQLRPASKRLSADERLIAAQVLVDYHFAVQRYEQLDFLANLVEAPAQFERASVLMRARWLYTAGYAHYQTGTHAAAQAAWQRALAAADGAQLPSQQLLASLALARLLIDQGGLDEAQRLVDAVRPQWGAGRTAQLIELKQLRGRLQLLRGQPVQALATLTDALQLGHAAGLSASEQASCQTDLAQVLVALEREAEALVLLERLAAAHGGRDAQVYRCLHRLLCAHRAEDDAAATAHLAAALALAQQIRYTMFFRLLPALAARLCALALRCGVARPFVDEVIRARALAAPDDADERWPWALWLRMLGGFELRLHGHAPAGGGGKTQHKPLELLRLLACERGLALAASAAVQALWPEAEDDAAGRKNLEMTVQRLRRLLGDATLVSVGDGRIALDATRVASDLAQRRRLVERLEALALHADARTDGRAAAAEALALAERVLALSGGELLPGMPDAAWLAAARRRCEQELVRAALAAAAVLAREGAGAAERELLQRALRSEPLAESLAGRLMQSFAAAGQRGDALRVFEDLRRALAERGAAPGAATLAQWQALLQRATT